MSIMENKPGVEVKRVIKLVAIARKSFKRDFTPLNIKTCFKIAFIWVLKYNTLIHDSSCSQEFNVGDHEEVDSQDHVDSRADVDIVDNMLSPY